MPVALLMGQQIISRSQLEPMDRLYRNNLINSISGFKSANLIGTKGAKGVTNLAIFSSVTHFGSNPPLLGFVTRPTVVPRNTYENILREKFYTINHVHAEITAKAHQTSAKYEGNESEFEICGFEEQWTNHPAPYVKECKVKIGLSLAEKYHIKANDTILVLGNIEEIIVDEGSIGVDGFLDLSKVDTVAINGLDSYLSVRKIARYSYARPGQQLELL